MPQMIKMVAVVAFDRNGRHLKVGDLFDAYPIEAASLTYSKKAKFHAGAVAAPARSYQTRHMTAAAPGAGSPEEAPREASTAPTQTAEAESTRTTEGGRSRRARGQGYNTRAIGASEE